jgi:hypothetical protein
VPISRTSDAQIQSSPAPLQIENENVGDRVEEESDKSLSPLEPKLPKLPKVVISDPSDLPLLEEDQNESWKKFLFGGIGDVPNVEAPIPECKAVPSQKGVRFGTSILGQASEDGSAIPTLNTGFHVTNTPYSISGGTSRITEASPYPTGSTYRESCFNLASTVDFSSQECGGSVQAEKGSVLASSSDSIQVSMVETVSPYRPHRKVTFTRSRPFVGQRANLDFVE